MAYDTDILDGFDPRRPATFPTVVAAIGMVVEDRASGFCGDIVRMSSEAVTLRDRATAAPLQLEARRLPLRGHRRHADPTGTGRRPPAGVHRVGLGRRRRAGGAAARASRIWVEGRHDAELIEHVWGDDLRDLGIVVEPMHGVDHLPAAVAEFGPGPERRLGVLVDHLVDGLEGVADGGGRGSGARARERAPVRRRVGRHPAHGDRARRLARRAHAASSGRRACAPRSGTDLGGFWPRLRNRVTSYADLATELVGAVEELIDFVT